MSKGFILEKLGELCKLLPGNIGNIAFGGCYGRNVETFLSDIWFNVKLINKGYKTLPSLRHIITICTIIYQNNVKPAHVQTAI